MIQEEVNSGGVTPFLYSPSIMTLIYRHALSFSIQAQMQLTWSEERFLAKALRIACRWERRLSV